MGEWRGTSDEIVTMLMSFSGTYCHFAGGSCRYNNTRECPKQSVLKHCNVLRESNLKEAGNDKDLRETVRGEL